MKETSYRHNITFIQENFKFKDDNSNDIGAWIMNLATLMLVMMKNLYLKSEVETLRNKEVIKQTIFSSLKFWVKGGNSDNFVLKLKTLSL
jgi:hypothetical protein